MIFSILSRTNVDTVEDSYLLSSPSNSPTILSLLSLSFSRFCLNCSICLSVFSLSLSCYSLRIIFSLFACSVILLFLPMFVTLDPEFSPSSSSITLSLILSSMAPLYLSLLEEPRLASASKRFESSAMELVEFLSDFLLGVRFSPLNMISSWIDSPIEEPLLANGWWLLSYWNGRISFELLSLLCFCEPVTMISSEIDWLPSSFLNDFFFTTIGSSPSISSDIISSSISSEPSLYLVFVSTLLTGLELACLWLLTSSFTGDLTAPNLGFCCLSMMLIMLSSSLWVMRVESFGK